MKRRPALAVACALAAAASLALTGCDASPYAAQVGGQTISRAALDNQLKQWAGNQTWTSAFDGANSQQNGGSGATVRGTGGAGTYGSAFVADVLSYNIEGLILHQHLSSTGQLPTSSELVAARAAQEAGTGWFEFPQSLRQLQTERVAEQAVLTPISTDRADLQSVFQQIEPSLFSNLCLTEESTETLAQAQAVTAVAGTPVCYDQAAMEDQPSAFRAAVLKLRPGHVSAPIKTGFGYQVVEVRSKDTPGFDAGVQRVLSAVIESSPAPAITDLVAKASVKVNPAYGTWSDGQVKTPQLTSS